MCVAVKNHSTTKKIPTPARLMTIEYEIEKRIEKKEEKKYLSTLAIINGYCVIITVVW